MEKRAAQNRLKDEQSPYLRQHAGNPVDWHPWSPEAVGKARDEDKPILLSIGYSTCHWCHVMARESFEDPGVARLMNENFINIKVDREEHPDIDSLYMKAVQAMTGQGGWPLTVFATPEGVPFYGGTYFPPEERGGMPSFKMVMETVARAYRENTAGVENVSEGIRKALGGVGGISPVELNTSVALNALSSVEEYFDPVNGGFGAGAKFPHSMFLKFLLLYHKRTGAEKPLTMLTRTLQAMAGGGIYDHLGGGFHRYTVDPRWEVPHFEKMLYDNVLLTELYSLAYEVTGTELYKAVATGTIEYLLRDMLSPEGGFYSAEDADAGGEEGTYYAWALEEVREILGPDDAPRFIEYYSMTGAGNFEGRNTLRIDAEARGGVSTEWLAPLRERLLEARRRRTPPGVDRKIITGWNSLAITALLEAGRVFNNPAYIEGAQRCARVLLNSLSDSTGRLRRYYLDGKADARAGLEDYALLGRALCTLYSVTGEPGWRDEAGRLARAVEELFCDPSTGLFFDAGSDNNKLFVRSRDLYDNDLPSGNSAAAGFFIMLSEIDEGGWREKGREILKSIEGVGGEPLYHGNALCVIESLLAGEDEAGGGRP